MKKVSLIIPVFNGEKYLEKCLNSVIKQSYSEMEILLIDDGSNDKSLQMCKEFEKKDSRIKVFSHKNQGVSFTRNRGLKFASGDYIMFLDIDDCIESGYIERFVKTAIKTNSDIIIGGIVFFNENRVIFPFENINLDKKEFLYNVGMREDGLYGYVASKMYKRAFLQNNHIMFNEKMHAQEDLDFALACYNKAITISEIDYSGYYYWFLESKRSVPTNDLIHNKLKLIKILENNAVQLAAIKKTVHALQKQVYVELLYADSIDKIFSLYKISGLVLALKKASVQEVEMRIIFFLFSSKLFILLLIYLKLRRIGSRVLRK